MAWGDLVLETVAAEFADADDVAQLIRIVVCLMLVAIGSAMFVLIPQQTGIVPDGLGRETTAIVSALLALAVLSLVPRVMTVRERFVGSPSAPSESVGRDRRIVAAPDDAPPPR